jgi:hypothetical protein
MWQRGDSGTGRTWEQANAYCDNLELDGYTDWRLPEIEALRTIVDYARFNPALSSIFDPRRSHGYWSSNTYVSIPDDAWAVGFYYGEVYAPGKTGNDVYVRCVRSGP